MIAENNGFVTYRAHVVHLGFFTSLSEGNSRSELCIHIMDCPTLSAQALHPRYSHNEGLSSMLPIRRVDGKKIKRKRISRNPDYQHIVLIFQRIGSLIPMVLVLLNKAPSM